MEKTLVSMARQNADLMVNEVRKTPVPFVQHPPEKTFQGL
jgi:hypothetical protein